MKTIKFTIEPQGVFSTPLQGDTFFGQLCWAIIRMQGEEALNALLADYHQNPFIVISDAFPSGFLQKPTLPVGFMGKVMSDPALRKEFKRKQWVPLCEVKKPISEWLAYAKTDNDILCSVQSNQKHLTEWRKHMHNSINRLTGTTGEGGFSPYAVEELWFAEKINWDIYIVIDEKKIELDQVRACIEYIGKTGYGKDASIGSGRFAVGDVSIFDFPHHTAANAVMTLANVAPQGLPLNEKGCFYQPFTRYGRHGDWAVLVNPYKSPILMAKTGAVLTPNDTYQLPYIGQGLGGSGEISRVIPQTVHQGYAPVLRIELPLGKGALDAKAS